MSETLVLDFGVGGYCRGNQEIQLFANEDGTYRSHRKKVYSLDDIVEEDVEVTADQVEEFMAAAAEMGVFEWEAKYFAKHLDGSDWNLAIKFPGRPEVKSRGLSNQPREFYDFMKLLQHIGFW